MTENLIEFRNHLSLHDVEIFGCDVDVNAAPMISCLIDIIDNAIGDDCVVCDKIISEFLGHRVDLRLREFEDSAFLAFRLWNGRVCAILRDRGCKFRSDSFLRYGGSEQIGDEFREKLSFIRIVLRKYIAEQFKEFQ